MNRWDEIRYIDFFDALKTIRENKDLFVEDPVLKNWVNNEKNIKDMVKIYKWTGYVVHAISEYRKLFRVLINKHQILKTYIHFLIKNKSDTII